MDRDEVYFPFQSFVFVTYAAYAHSAHGPFPSRLQEGAGIFSEFVAASVAG